MMSHSLSVAFKSLRSLNVITAALVVQFLVSVAFNLMGSFMPLFISSDLNKTLIEATYWTGIASFISAFILAITAPFWGWMCDRVGTKKILIMVIAGNVVVFGGMAAATNVLQIVLYRALQGAFGGISTVMFAVVVAVSSPNDIKRVLSFQMAAMTMGGLVAPGIGGALASIIGYRMTLAVSALLFFLIIPLVSILSLPPPSSQATVARFGMKDFFSILPDGIALILVYICLSFITPIIPWYIESLGVQYDQLLLYTTATTVLNGLAYAVATPTLTRIVDDRTLPIFSLLAAILIEVTTFVVSPIQFIVLRIAIGAVQAGIPPNLLGGKSGRKGTGMGFLNSARFLGMAFGPVIATNILGDGVPPRPLYMYSSIAAFSLLATIFIYLTHTRKKVKLE
jgi:DHA1 family multidrug resistance protein-like MFS transporter